MGGIKVKKARALDYWRRLGSVQRGDLTLQTITLEELEGFSGEDIQISTGVHAICGLNSSGKTRLLRSLFEKALDGQHEDSEIHYFDPSWLVQRQRLQLFYDSNIQDRISNAGSTRFQNRELDSARYLLSRNYEWIEVSELEAVDLADVGKGDSAINSSSLESGEPAINKYDFRGDVTPFFRVRISGQEFSSFSLSTGELSGLTLLWMLKQLSRNSLIFIDEPEAFLSSNASEKVLNLIAEGADRTNSQVLMATHSIDSLLTLETDFYSILTPSYQCETLTTVKAGARRLLEDAMRVSLPTAFLFVVEDEAAVDFAQILLPRIGFPLKGQGKFVVAGGSEDARHASYFPPIDGKVKVVTLADGDEKSRQSSKHKYGTSVAFLPGDECVEREVLKRLVGYLKSREFETAKAEIALTHVRGMDAHDAFSEVAKQLGWGFKELFTEVLRWWMDQSDGLQALVTFEKELLNAFQVRSWEELEAEWPNGF